MEVGVRCQDVVSVRLRVRVRVKVRVRVRVRVPFRMYPLVPTQIIQTSQ